MKLFNLLIIAANAELCEDKYSTCASMAKLCDNPAYEGVKVYCAKTCDSCQESRTAVLEFEDPETQNSVLKVETHDGKYYLNYL